MALQQTMWFTGMFSMTLYYLNTTDNPESGIKLEAKIVIHGAVFS